jgi:hypothetical protein
LPLDRDPRIICTGLPLVRGPPGCRLQHFGRHARVRCARSHKDARGIMQLIPETAERIATPAGKAGLH